MRNETLRNKDGQTLEEFLAAYHPGDWPQPSVTVDLLVFSLADQPRLLMVRRGNHPWLNCWALPGGFVEPGEFTKDAAAREGREEGNQTGLPLSPIGLFSGPDRDPRCWSMSDAFVAVVDDADMEAIAGDDAAEVGWFTLDYTMGPDRLHITLKRGQDTLSANVAFRTQNGAFGAEPIIGDFQCDDIACDHSKMIAAAILKLRQVGKI